MPHRRFALLVAAALLAAPQARAGKEPVYAVVGARVVTVSGPTHEAATIVLREGVIEAVGTGIAVPPDARVIDGKGLTLTPGIIDAFGAIGLPAPPPGRPGAGGEAPRTEAPKADPLAPQADALDRVTPAEAVKARDRGITTALVISPDGVLPGRSVLLDLAGDTAEAMVLKQPAALHLHMATLPRQYPSSLMGTVAYARQALLDARRYREEWSAYDRAPRGKTRPRYSAALEAWQPVLAGTLPLVVTASRENDVRRALALADEFGLRLALAGAPQAHRVAALLKARKVPLAVSVNFDPPRPLQVFGAPDEDKEKRDIEDAESNPAKLHEAGVPFALASGHAADFLAGVRKAVDKGLPRDAALRAVTLEAARVLGVDDRLGSLEAGKIANVVAWAGEPLTKDAKPKLVFVDGRLYEPEEKDKEKEKKEPEKGADEPGVFRSEASPRTTEAGFTPTEVFDDGRAKRGRQLREVTR